MSLARLGRTSDALGVLTSVDQQRLSPELESGVTFEIALCLDAEGKRGEARERLQQLLAKPSSYRPYAALELMRLALEGEEFDEVGRLLEAQRAFESEARPVERSTLEERRIYMASVLAMRKEQPADVIALLGAFETRFPASSLRASALLLRGLAESSLRRFEEARASFAALVEMAIPTAMLETALLRLAETYAALERWPDAEAAFSQFLATFPDSAQASTARFGRGWAREQRGALESAIASYREVLTVAPTGTTSAGPVAARAQFQIGECHFALKQYEDAVRELLKVDVLYAYPEWSAAALYEAGRCLVALGRPSEARRQFMQLRERFPTSPWAERAARELERLAPDALPGKTTG
jgi:TolA-binding protein